ncbi:uncharacterized protein N7496_007412 [Penicillium cataractarum]|uniref:Uncharacterized protein n=1 Tax=Penicillium cataractarum TaxID=2100454 RepID=A0A9W9V9G6_9EURO|nr:uncharacterized protein N7496_007412 [Penicillium cataractarum]KAJ5371320.1 hypothetical protein N7496_007412 [Penicillium cataractarum]
METDTAQLIKSCKKLERILESLLPNPSRPSSLVIGKEDYNPHIFETELLRLGIELHHIVIETGSISPPAKTFFLPKTDFTEISDACKQNTSWIKVCWGEAIHAAAKPKGERKLFSDKPELFALALLFDFEEYSFEGKKGLDGSFNLDSFHFRRPPEAVQPSRYGWMCDHETKDIRSNPRFKREFQVLDTVPDEMRHFRRRSVHTGVTRLSGGDELLVDYRCHVWAYNWVGQCGNDSRPSRDEIVVLVYTMLESMLCATHNAGQRSYNPNFPTLLFLSDQLGHCRILSGYYDGKLHVGLTRLLDFSEYALVPPAGMSYLESIDQDKFYQMMNMLLKWAWPVALDSTNEEKDIPVIVDLPWNDHQDTEKPDESHDDWVKV